jgi:hypothetical protein
MCVFYHLFQSNYTRMVSQRAESEGDTTITTSNSNNTVDGNKNGAAAAPLPAPWQVTEDYILWHGSVGWTNGLGCMRVAV